MFRFHKSLDVITLFHKPSVPASLRVLTLLKQISAHASETATEDQAGDHSHQNKLQRTEFQLNVTEDPPTGDQLRTIIEYTGDRKASQIVEGARDAPDAVSRLAKDIRKFKAPVVGRSAPGLAEYDADEIQTVDWNNGRAVVGDKESEIMMMISQLPKETKKV